ncbi:emp24/gp25L/p24 family/GOLD family protein [Actinidia rufa]|uniref:Emp24/gp25L/p24 family/GOLD family protein n=1 Tax=Actinidia rufa TaxID=165716 RepID=A0A7J0EWX4_9ERIC|nr:emp24/gp25L/p24 family/GOLD family protein [Actinidia rufa]
MGKGANVRSGVLFPLLMLCLTSGLLPVGESIWLNLPATGTKCVSEEIHNNVVVLADYVVISEDHTQSSPTLSAKGLVPMLSICSCLMLPLSQFVYPFGESYEARIFLRRQCTGVRHFMDTDMDMDTRGTHMKRKRKKMEMGTEDVLPLPSLLFRRERTREPRAFIDNPHCGAWEPLTLKSVSEALTVSYNSSEADMGKLQCPSALRNIVTSPYGNNLHHLENVTHGQFAFTTKEAGNYLACFWVDGHHQGGGDVSVNLEWRIGIAAKDWDSVARKEKIEGVEIQLRKLEGAVEAIHENLLYLKSREADMREVSESTNARVAWFSIMSLGICIVVSVTQLWHLKRFFQKKKLI